MGSSGGADRVALAGAAGATLALARALVRAGRGVILIEADRHDAARARAMLARAAPELEIVTPDDAPRAAVLIVGAGFPDAALQVLRVRMAPAALGFVGPDRPHDGIGLHLHATAGPVTLAELVLPDPAPPGAALVQGMLADLGVPVLHTGGIGPMLRDLWLDRLDAVLLAGATPSEIDEAATGLGFAIGPYEQEDLAGLDLRHPRRIARGGAFRGLAEHAAAEGRIGKKGGVGWYRYPGGGGAVIDPLVEDLLRHEAHFARLAQTPQDDASLRRMVLSSLADAAADTVRAGRGSAGDVDRVALAALGFPAGLGGPLAWAARQAGAR